MSAPDLTAVKAMLFDALQIAGSDVGYGVQMQKMDDGRTFAATIYNNRFTTTFNADNLAATVAAWASTRLTGIRVFAVFRQGVYRHECGGIFSTLDAAKECADMLASEDVDDHHLYEVVPFLMNYSPVLPETDEDDNRSPPISEMSPVYITRKRRPPPVAAPPADPMDPVAAEAARRAEREAVDRLIGLIAAANTADQN